MSAPRIVVDEKPDPHLRDEISRPLRAFNESKVGKINIEPLAICLRHPESDAVMGGLWGQIVLGWLHVDLLVVPEEFRGQGIGTSLMKKAEEIATQRNCVGVWLCTSTFQAPCFYEKMGYRSFGKLSDYPKGHDNLYYTKSLPVSC